MVGALLTLTCLLLLPTEDDSGTRWFLLFCLVAFAALTAVAYRRANRLVTRRLSGRRCMARVDYNESMRLGLSYFTDGKTYHESIWYGSTPDEGVVLRSLRNWALRHLDKPDVDDPGEWLENLQRGDTVEVAVDLDDPRKFVIPELYVRRHVSSAQIAVLLVLAALLLFYAYLQLSNPVG